MSRARINGVAANPLLLARIPGPPGGPGGPGGPGFDVMFLRARLTAESTAELTAVLTAKLILLSIRRRISSKVAGVCLPSMVPNGPGGVIRRKSLGNSSVLLDDVALGRVLMWLVESVVDGRREVPDDAIDRSCRGEMLDDSIAVGGLDGCLEGSLMSGLSL